MAEKILTAFCTPEECNEHYHSLLSQGILELNMDFDLPTRIGYDSDHALAEGEVGRTGVSVNSIRDLQTLFEGIRLEDISTRMNISATGYILLAFYTALARQQGANLKKITGTIQNDILKEYAVRGNYIYPPEPSMQIITDIFEWCSQELPEWKSISISGYHIHEAGSTAVQEIATALFNGKAYVRAAMAKGLDINVFGRQLSFYFDAHNDFFGEIARFRAARKVWASMMKEMGATDPAAMMLKGYDGAVDLSTEEASRIDLLTHEAEEKAWEIIAQIDAPGGSVSAIENRYIREKEGSSPPTFKTDESVRQARTEKLAALRNDRNPARCDSILQDLNDKASSGENIMPVVIEAAENSCTLGEIADTLREIFGEYK